MEWCERPHNLEVALAVRETGSMGLTAPPRRWLAARERRANDLDPDRIGLDWVVNTFSPRRTLAFIGAEPARSTERNVSPPTIRRMVTTANCSKRRWAKGVARSGARYKGCTLKFSGIAA